MQISFEAHPEFMNMDLIVRGLTAGFVQKLYAAIADGRLKPGPYAYLDGEVDDDGVSWINAEVDGAFSVGANDEDGLLRISVGLKGDPLDGTADLNCDPDDYWTDFLVPLKRLLAIVQ